MELGIERFHSSYLNTSIDMKLMSVVLKFLSKSIKSFMLPFSPISITLRDIIVLMGLLIWGDDALCLLDIQDSSLLAIEVSSTTQTSYFAIIRKWHDVTRVPFTTEHVEFLWVLLCRYVFFPSSRKPIMEYLPLAKTLALSQPYALGTLLLASVYQAMSKYVYDEPYHKVGGALWFIQMWFFAYFLELLDMEPTSYKTLGLHVTHSLRTMPFDDLMSFFLGLVDWALIHLYLRLDSIHISTWNQIIASSQPYLPDLENPLAFSSVPCRVLILGDCFAFSSSMFASPTSL